MITLASLAILGNLLLVVLMFKTEKRTLQNMRPEPSENIHAVLLSSEVSHKRFSWMNDGPYMRVKFLDKVIQGKEGVNLFQFRVTTHEDSREPIKMTKRYSDFLNLEKTVHQILLK
jgi:hypothetical protein